ncbi:uncharacterized protein MELLADRAFT_95186 [Melampsora larici-populina 98AG31]|uniref:Uncharacterized protein n=1 Tax=Melampsora larici-populina (strain 98AG31 / pathotype 3-4-7) TaxID=747676 RepID=F4RCG1_MELLP|nr:uncharacterized protein MELLADRAFT_95186 [Melampsora larici-populina 98AG31]EGG09726.1 hypothetical protein MELLADRAFT_95186 [Melampsora larici-populina 98AG31]
MVETRSKQPESTQANPAAKSKSKTKGSSKKRQPQPPSGRKKQKQQLVEDDADESFHIDSNDVNNQPRDEPNLTCREEAEEDESAPPAVFLSRFPGLELGDFEKQLDDWTLVSLRQAISKQASKRSKAPGEIQLLVRIRLEYEKRMLMAALMGAVPKVVIWNLVGKGSKQGHANPWIRFLAFGLPALAEKVPESGDSEGWTRRNKKVSDLWKKLSKDEKDVFRDPYFFALAKLPNLSTLPMDITKPAEDGGDTSLQHLNESMPAPTVHKLTDEQKTKYMPLFEKLVDVEKLHLCHGKPSPSTPVATIQQKSLVELRKAHHTVRSICFHLDFLPISIVTLTTYT